MHWTLHEIDMPQVNKIVTIFIYNMSKKVWKFMYCISGAVKILMFFISVRCREIQFKGNFHFVPKNVPATKNFGFIIIGFIETYLWEIQQETIRVLYKCPLYQDIRFVVCPS